MMRPVGGDGRARAGGAGLGRWPLFVLVLVALLTVTAIPASARALAQDLSGLSLDIIVLFPDGGPTEGELVCLTLFPDDGSDLATATPLQTACLAAGQDRARFPDLGVGGYRVVAPTAASLLTPPRYQGRIAAVEIPDDPVTAAFEIDLSLELTPELAGTTGVIQVNVYGCPPGTDGGGDATAWRQECDALIGGAPVSLSGIGTIERTAIADVTAQDGDAFGRVEFADLPAGEYSLDEVLPADAAENPAFFVESSIDGGLPAPINPNEPVAVRPAEVLAVDVYVPLPGDQASPRRSRRGTESATAAAGADPGVGPDAATTDPTAAATTAIDPVAAGLTGVDGGAGVEVAVSGGLPASAAPLAPTEEGEAAATSEEPE